MPHDGQVILHDTRALRETILAFGFTGAHNCDHPTPAGWRRVAWPGRLRALCSQSCVISELKKQTSHTTLPASRQTQTPLSDSIVALYILTAASSSILTRPTVVITAIIEREGGECWCSFCWPCNPSLLTRNIIQRAPVMSRHKQTPQNHRYPLGSADLELRREVM